MIFVVATVHEGNFQNTFGQWKLSLFGRIKPNNIEEKLQLREIWKQQLREILKIESRVGQ